MRIFGYVKVALFTTVNILLNGATLGRYVWLEGRVERGVFTNWARRFRYVPKRFAKPATEREIVELIRNAGSVRVFGSGHSFNSGVVSDETLVSLDDYSGLVWKDLDKKQVAVKGGTRVRDVVALLLEEGLAFRALPSHDAQSIAGILSTDVHGTGREWGFVNESVVGLKHYAAAEDQMKEIGARPHLGKFCETIDAEYLARLHQDSFTTFLELVGRHDPGGNFSNDLTRRLFRRGP
jgi:FAD/FMN-containing dehydrogenase